MPKAASNAQRVTFVAVSGSSKLYREAAKLEGVRVDAWIRAILHDAAIEVFEAHGRDTSNLPAVHIQRPPRLQPRFGGEPDENEGT